jgi:hypothetical protein
MSHQYASRPSPVVAALKRGGFDQLGDTTTGVGIIIEIADRPGQSRQRKTEMTTLCANRVRCSVRRSQR